MGRFDYEKNAQSAWGSRRPKGQKPQRMSPKKAKANMCRKCHCAPCAGLNKCQKQDQATGKTGWCAVIAAFLVSGLIGAAYGLFEAIHWVVT